MGCAFYVKFPSFVCCVYFFELISPTYQSELLPSAQFLYLAFAAHGINFCRQSFGVDYCYGSAKFCVLRPLVCPIVGGHSLGQVCRPSCVKGFVCASYYVHEEAVPYVAILGF